MASGMETYADHDYANGHNRSGDLDGEQVGCGLDAAIASLAVDFNSEYLKHIAGECTKQDAYDWSEGKAA